MIRMNGRSTLGRRALILAVSVVVAASSETVLADSSLAACPTGSVSERYRTLTMRDDDAALAAYERCPLPNDVFISQRVDETHEVQLSYVFVAAINGSYRSVIALLNADVVVGDDPSDVLRALVNGTEDGFEQGYSVAETVGYVRRIVGLMVAKHRVDLSTPSREQLWSPVFTAFMRHCLTGLDSPDGVAVWSTVLTDADIEEAARWDPRLRLIAFFSQENPTVEYQNAFCRRTVDTVSQAHDMTAEERRMLEEHKAREHSPSN